MADELERIAGALERIATVFERMGPRVLTVEEVAERVASQKTHADEVEQAALQEEYDAAKAAVAVYEAVEATEKRDKIGVGPGEEKRRKEARDRLAAAEKALGKKGGK